MAYAFHCHLVDALVMKHLIHAIREIVVEANFDCSPSGMQLQAMDASHTCLAFVDLQSSGFTEYECNGLLSIGLNMEHMRKMMEPICLGHCITFTVLAPKEQLEIRIAEVGNEDAKVEWQMNLIDIDADHMAVPEEPPMVAFSMSSEEFYRICSTYLEFADALEIDVAGRSVTFCPKASVLDPEKEMSPGESTGSTTVLFRPREQSTYGAQKDITHMACLETDTTFESVQQVFSLPFLLAVSKARTLAPRVTLHMTPQAPLVVMYSLGKLGTLRYFIAAKC